ncbi:unnamed protein product [Rotaria socialis]|uniref:cytidine deaminase n=1 Tax=Rotaria socialis TaxID=392032 RepID=A0A820QIN7_9BILA|nr:unnamed protein product [Rotaria socialis]
MLIKEYRIPVPMTVGEYRIAQLYMIVKKSREETNCSGSGVEIIRNEPYTDGPGGSGQYTFKIYHIERHLPGWFKAILPANAMKIEEEAWNAYPYTKTRYRCPFIDRFLLEVETCYQADFGTQENIFNLKSQEIEQRTVEFLDIVHSQPLADIPTENPAMFRSEKTGRGPLAPDWFEQIKKYDRKESIMCAYKLCRAEFRYWGMQSRCERFIHEIALRKTILRAHRQAWCWQDEYQGLTLADIRRLEDETQHELNNRMAQFQIENSHLSFNNNNNSTKSTDDTHDVKQPLSIRRSRQMSIDNINASRPRINSFPVPPLPRDEISDDEFFDAETFIENMPNVRSSRSLIYSTDDIQLHNSMNSDSHQSSIDDDERACGLSASDDNNNKCTIEILILIFYGGNIYSTEDAFVSAKKTDFISFRSTFETIVRNHYPSVEGKTAIRFVECRSICIEAIELLNRLSPYGALNITHDISHGETLPINAIPLFATSNSGYQTNLANVVASANKVYQEFISSKEGRHFSGQVVIIGDANGAILAYDALCLNHTLDDTTSLYGGEDGLTPRTPALGKRTHNETNDANSGNSSNRLSAKCTVTNDNVEVGDNVESLRTRQENSSIMLGFDVNEFFSFGSPLSLILAYRQMVSDRVVRPCCGQLYNLFHACDPNASRIEPLIQSEFSQIPPCCIPRYSQFPLGDGESTLLIEYIHQYSKLFLNNSTNQVPNATNILFADIRQTWWGSRRTDYIVYCPESLMSQPAHVLPIVFHSSYWESRDVMSFILRNITRNQEQFHLFNSPANTNPCSFAPVKPTERWLHRTTAVKIRNLAPNHRGNDTMVVDARAQTIHAKFHYGPIDMVCLANEKVDIYVMRSAPYGEWTLLDTAETDTHGRVRYTISDDKKLPLGLHPVKLVVRGDHTTIDLYLTVLPPKSEAVIFSIDGSFTSSFSVSHHDPKVRPGAVDVVRYWQELGYIIIYVTARPDIQQQQVVHWLAQHNFPHGMTLFNDGIYREPIKHKSEMLRQVVENADLVITAAYGSSKDVPGYQLIHIPADKTFVVGKVKNRLQGQARFLVDGYALHLTELSKPGTVRPSKSNSRHLIRRACFNLPKSTTTTTTAQSTISLINSKQSNSLTAISMPATQHPVIDQSLSVPLTHRKANLNDETNDSQHHRLVLSTSQSKDAPSRGISPRINHNRPPTKLFREAHLAKHKAYCPYSKFRVGAALLATSGKIYSGCNIENASYALATCAERTAVVKAVSEGEKSFKKLAITSDVELGFTGPCGSCRQTLAEFGLDLDVYLVNAKNESKLYKLQELLPIAFTPSDLERPRSNHDIM